MYPERIDKRTIETTGSCDTREELESRVRQLKARKIPNRAVAKMLGVSSATVSRIMGGTKRNPSKKPGNPMLATIVMRDKLRQHWPVRDLSFLEADGEV